VDFQILPPLIHTWKVNLGRKEFLNPTLKLEFSPFVISRENRKFIPAFTGRVSIIDYLGVADKIFIDNLKRDFAFSFSYNSSENIKKNVKCLESCYNFCIY
jgi:hypothetical protein